MPPRRIFIFGASGAGVTTLGAATAARLRAAHFDVDDYYWLPTDPPYRVKREVAERVRLLAQGMRRLLDWVVSGSLDGWGDRLVADADLFVYLNTPTETRIARLRRRETERFGGEVLPGGTMAAQHQAFLDWAAGYEIGAAGGRSRPRHEAWLARITRPILRLDGLLTTNEQVRAILADD